MYGRTTQVHPYRFVGLFHIKATQAWRNKVKNNAALFAVP